VRPRWSGVAPGRDHGVCNLHQGASGAIGYTRVARPNGSSDEEPAGAPGARPRRALIAIGLLELGYAAVPLNLNCCCYCGGSFGSSFGSGLVVRESRAEVQAALRLAEQQAREPATPQGRA